MLLSFRFANHRSIRDEQILHMQPVYDKGRPALPVAALFGANAAGKSNVLDALGFMLGAVRDSFGTWRGGAVPRTPFALDDESRAAASTFAVELLLDGVRWVYGFTIDSEAILTEWLHSYPQHRRRIVFERTNDNVRFGSTAEVDRSLAKNLATFMVPTSLFLSILSKARAVSPAGLGRVHDWFDSAVVITAGNAVADEQAIIERLEDAPSRRRMVALLAAADVGIVDVDVEHLLPKSTLAERGRLDQYAEATEQLTKASSAVPDDVWIADRIDWLKEKLQHDREVAASSASAEKRLVFVHGSAGTKFYFSDESQGTKVWLGYLGSVLDALDSGSLLIIDEIDTSLHPHLTAQLVRIFRDPDANSRGAQLVFTTHDATLLGRAFGEEILGRDEIWFVEKNQQQATELFSLADFKARKDDNVLRRYLTGSYGAIPQPGELRFGDAMRGRSA